jgi:cytochrome b
MAIAGGDGIEPAAASNSPRERDQVRYSQLDGVLRRSDNGQAPGLAMSKGSRIILVWDAPIRLFHWIVAALVVAAYATWRLNWMDWHGRIGDALLALLVFRLSWGFFGSETARFSRFLASPRTVMHYLRHWFRREPDCQVGHNPAGGWVVALLLALLLAETLTGLYVANDIADEGPLTEIVPARVANAISAAHGILWDLLLVMIVLHVLAIAAYAAAKGQNLLLPMITGTKAIPAGVAAPRMESHARAAFLLAGGAAVAAILANLI